MDKIFSISDALNFGLNTFKKKMGLILGALFVSWAIPFVPSMISEYLKDYQPVWSLIFSMINLVLSLFLSIGFIRILLNIHDDKEADINMLFSGKDLILNFMVFSILYSLMVMGGMLLLIVPGIIVMTIYQFGSFAVVDSHLNPIEALNESAYLTKGVRIEIFKFIFVNTLINIVGLLCLGIGLIFTVPITTLATIYVYRILQAIDHPDEIDPS